MESLANRRRLTVTLSWLVAVMIGAAMTLTATGAFAASPAPAAYDWSGFYIGGNVGYGWGKSSNQFAFVDTAVPFAAAQSQADGLNGIIGGVQFGYNWQASANAVLGLETDWQGSGRGAGRSFVNQIILPEPVVPPDTDTMTTNYGSKISWFGTVRGRVGYAWDSLLLYGTGGLAYGEVGLSGTLNEAVNLLNSGGPDYTATTPFSISVVKAGWTIGAGIEQALSVDWGWKIEYLYVDLGKISGVFPAQNPGFPTETISAQSHFAENVLRVGLNYRFK